MLVVRGRPGAAAAVAVAEATAIVCARVLEWPPAMPAPAAAEPALGSSGRCLSRLCPRLLCCRAREGRREGGTKNSVGRRDGGTISSNLGLPTDATAAAAASVPVTAPPLLTPAGEAAAASASAGTAATPSSDSDDGWLRLFCRASREGGTKNSVVRREGGTISSILGLSPVAAKRCPGTDRSRFAELLIEVGLSVSSMRDYKLRDVHPPFRGDKVEKSGCLFSSF